MFKQYKSGKKWKADISFLLHIPKATIINVLECSCVCSFQSCLTLWDPMDWSPPGSSVRGIFQARTLEWVAKPSSRGSSQGLNPHLLWLLHCRWILYPLSHLGSLAGTYTDINKVETCLRGVHIISKEMSSWVQLEYIVLNAQGSLEL